MKPEHHEKELRVIIAGSRNFCDFSKLADSCDNILSAITENNNDLEKIKIISGGARGADKLGEQYAEKAGYDASIFPADWNGLGKRAGYVRNVEMAKFAAENGHHGVLIAF